MRFAPIAIVGRACLLPGVHDPAQLWQAVAAGRDLLGPVPPGRWGLAPGLARCAPEQPQPDCSWSDRGGYVTGFEALWQPEGFAVPAAELHGLDPLLHWTLHSARAALRDAGAWSDGAPPRCGAIFGNLGFPSRGLADYAQAVWCGESGADPRNRFMAGGTAALLQRALALDGDCFSLDAACASSLYAIKLACDRLHDGSADLMLGGAVQGADDLFLHIGFCALQALSRSGRSRPFHAEADGLVPAEGAAFVVLKRLADARRDGDTIHGVIRGLGLANDGRGKGLLAPAEEGQRRAMQAAYAGAGFGPERVSLLECHATGTPVGDATELRSSAALFGACQELPIGSLKSNLGHLITAAGVAGLLKLLEALRAGQRPPTLHVEQPTAALAGTPFRLLHELEPWPAAGPRIAALSAFGFGGNDAHLIVSEDAAELDPPELAAEAPPPLPLALVGLECMAGSAADRDAFARALFDSGSLLDEHGEGRSERIALQLDGLRFPPHDLAMALPQQLALLQVARAALARQDTLPRERSGIYVGMEPDAEVARHGLRWRLARAGADPQALRQARDAVVAPLDAAAVVGCMPNIPANRLSAQFDLGGPSFTVQAGAASGLVALQLAARALRAGELDTALVGAVDLCCEPVQRAAAGSVPGDAAVLLLLKRLDTAQAAGDRILALLDPAPPAPGEPPPAIETFGHAELAARCGDSGAAAGLLQVAAAALALQHRRRLDGRPWLAAGMRQARVEVPGSPALTLHESTAASPLPGGPRLHCFAGADRAAVLAALRDGREALHGPARLALVASAGELAGVRQRAIAHLEHGAPAGPAISYREAPLAGRLAFVFGSAGAAYHGMGRGLLAGLPQLLQPLASRSRRLATALDWALAPDSPAADVSQQLWGASALAQLHLELSQGVLGLQPAAWLGYSSGETNALFGAGVWDDPDQLIERAEASALMTRELGGEFAAVARQWGGPVDWQAWTVLASPAELAAVLPGFPQLRLTVIHHDRECLVAGAAAQCQGLVQHFGAERCMRMGYPLAVHVPELGAVRDSWLALHTRPTRAPVHGRIYSNGFGGPYQPSPEACAQAILVQAERTLDLRPAVLAAWDEGVRIFVEHGPGRTYGRAIRHILAGREALVVALDGPGGRLDGTLQALATLWTAGLELDLAALDALLAPDPPAPAGRVLEVAAHPPPVRLLPVPELLQPMPPAPPLPSVFEPPSAAVVPAARPVPASVADGAPRPARPLAEVAVRPGVPPSSPALAAFVAQAAGLATVQQAFLHGQATAHQQFLALRQSALAVLLQAGRGMAADAEAPEAVVLQPGYAPAGGLLQPTSAARPAATPPPAAVRFTRAQLEQHAGGRISELFGPLFEPQDGHARQVRMPLPPLLLADEVLELQAEPASMGRGQVVTRTRVGADAWYLHQGRMPAGIMIEAGQADLLLISYLGIDLHNRGERVYRLLGCELTYHGDLPRVGDTLRFDIHIDGHAAQGAVRLMFFHYQCHNGDRPQLSVRQGQAGFFSDAELADSAGCLWSPESQAIVAQPRLDPALVECQASALDATRLRAFAAGDPYACFGPGFERARCHTRSPAIQAGRMLLLDRVTELAARGGPWGRGYLRAELDLQPDQWFFAGHFKNDPCMPGTLMFEGCLQAMAVWLAAQGHTLARDGWRFQPVPELPYQLRCRGQATPDSRLLVTEVFVEEVSAGPLPTVYADLLCTVDGLKAFHARRVALQLVPDWPLDERAPVAADPLAAEVEGFRFDQRSLLACAIGRPSAAFGPRWSRFDGVQRMARLPGPPYLFISRIRAVQGPIAVMQPGARVVAEYQIPPDAWYFEANGARTMPYAVLLEAALQPCGWLASYVGSALTEAGELCFRNLDGDGTLLAEIGPDAGTLTTEVELTEVSATGGMIIQGFAVRCRLGDREVYRLRTVFGFFPPEALAAQAGLRTSAAERELLQRPGAAIELHGQAAPWSAPGRPALAGNGLLMLDRIEGIWPASAEHGVQLRALKQVDTGEWFFKAHFFQDPVQPGSLGLEAMLQALQCLMLHLQLDAGITRPRFEPIALEQALQWKYRGQVLLHHQRIHTTLELLEHGRDSRGAWALARASLWADGQRIYEASGLGMRIVAGDG